jgi:TPP-dependent pyruvate/acetoin dehydrogenase alpha subunit
MSVQTPGAEPMTSHDLDLRSLHASMVRSRVLDDFTADLARRGLIGLAPPMRGYEAHVFGAMAALRPSDWLFGDLRTGVSAVKRGVSVREWLAQRLGTGSSAHAGHASGSELTAKEANVVSVSSLMGTQLVHAVGVAMGMKVRNDPSVVLAWYGPAAAATGDAHNAMNFAGVYDLPVIFYYCSSGDPAADAQRLGGERYADRAEGYGISGVTVDGSDIEAVALEVANAAARARTGGGSTIIEGVTSGDPMAAIEGRMTANGLDVASLRRAVATPLAASLREAVVELQAEGPPEISTLFDDVFESLDARLIEQRDSLLKHRARFGDGTVE